MIRSKDLINQKTLEEAMKKFATKRQRTKSLKRRMLRINMSGDQPALKPHLRPQT